MPVIFRVRREYDRLWEDANKLLPVQITSAVELDPSVAERIGDEIGRQTGRTVELTSTVDPEVLGWHRRARRELHPRRLHPHPTRATFASRSSNVA